MHASSSNATLDVFHLNDGKLFWVITLLLDIDMSDFVIKDSLNTDRTSCMQGEMHAAATLYTVPPTHFMYPVMHSNKRTISVNGDKLLILLCIDYKT